MQLRSNRVLKRPKPCTQNRDSRGKFVSGKKRSNEAEIVVCVDDDDLETGNGGNTDDKGLFLGSEVLDPVKDSAVSCPEGEIEEESIKCIHIGGDGGSSGEDKSIRKRGKKIKKNVGNVKKKESNQETQVEKNVEVIDDDDDECSHALMKSKTGQKRKNVETPECNGIQGGGRLLRSKRLTSGGGVVAIYGGTKVVLGLKRIIKEDDETGQLAVSRPKKKLKRCPKKSTEDEKSQPNLRPRKKLTRRGRLLKKSTKDEKSQLNLRPRKKLERRGRPLKKSTEEEKSQLNLRPRKKIERRGRPRKVNTETSLEKDRILTLKPTKKPKTETETETWDPLVPKRPRGRPRKDSVFKKHRPRKDSVFKKHRPRGRPPKMEAKDLANVIKKRTVKLMEVQHKDKVSKIQKIPDKDGFLEVNGETPQKVEITGGKQLKRRERKQLVRDKISEMLMNAGWIIDLRPRQEKSYNDQVYIEPNGRSHWSITKAYFMLKKKIENGNGDNNEVSAFNPISEEEIAMLFKVYGKGRPYKKRRKKIQRINEIQTTRKKKNGKKTEKDGSKRKLTWKSSSRLSKKTLNLKMKRNREKGIMGNVTKPRLLARGSEKLSNQESNGVLVYNGKRNLVSWMIESGVILVNSKVQYGKTRRQKRSFEGEITSDGIHCGCCDEIMSISRFVGHAGGGLDHLYDGVYLECGTSLLKCMMESWKKEEESNKIGFNHVDVKGDDPNDDTCNICGDGGNLICCDSCPSTFHESCLDIQNFPSGDWNCIYCCCKFCGVVSDSTSQMDHSHDELLSCGLCEEKFHESCLQEVETVNVDSEKLSFCGTKCKEIFARLQTYIGVKHELEDGFSWTLLHRSNVGQDFTVHNTRLQVECNSKLAVAYNVMDECFVPIIDDRSGTNIIHNVLYNCGSNFRRLDYAGFLTAILEKDDELITAASIRIHGNRLAEMPFIGTRHMYRRQGMCRRLLDAIEFSLCNMGVEELIIPAIPELLQTWKKVFGFMPIEDSQMNAMNKVNMIVFPGINMLRKPLQNQFPNTSRASKDKVAEFTTVKDEPEEEIIAIDDFTPQLETVILNKIDCNQRPTDDDSSEVEKNDLEYAQTVLTLPEENKSENALDLNFPEKNVECEILEPLTCKNTFDLNLDPNSVEEDSIVKEPQVCRNSVEILGSDDGQPLVML